MAIVLDHDDELEEIIQSWEYWCPNSACRNRTFSIKSDSGGVFYKERQNEDEYWTVRLLACDRCHSPLIIGTKYYICKDGKEAREPVMPQRAYKENRFHLNGVVEPLRQYSPEYVIFIKPSTMRELPKGLSKDIVESFREAEKAVDESMRISAAATIRNTIRLMVKDMGIDTGTLKQDVEKLPFAKAYVDAISNLKIIGDSSLHDDGYKLEEMRIALDVLSLSLIQYAQTRSNLSSLNKIVGDNASRRAKK